MSAVYDQVSDFVHKALVAIVPWLAGDVIVSRHWNSSGFANTDLDYQLRQRDVVDLVFAGLTANTCLESTARYARELGYHVTLLTDATAGCSPDLTKAGTTMVWPLIAEKVCTTQQWIESLGEEKRSVGMT